VEDVMFRRIWHSTDLKGSDSDSLRTFALAVKAAAGRAAPLDELIKLGWSPKPSDREAGEIVYLAVQSFETHSEAENGGVVHMSLRRGLDGGVSSVHCFTANGMSIHAVRFLGLDAETDYWRLMFYGTQRQVNNVCGYAELQKPVSDYELWLGGLRSMFRFA